MEWTWDQTDLNRNPLPPGIYDIVGTTTGITTEYNPVTRITILDPAGPVVDTAIVPEPGTIILVTLGFAGVFRVRRRSV